MIRAYENPLAFPGLRPAIQPVLKGGDRLTKSRYTYSPGIVDETNCLRKVVICAMVKSGYKGDGRPIQPLRTQILIMGNSSTPTSGLMSLSPT